MVRPQLAFRGISIALSLCGCTLDTNGLSADSRLTVLVDSGGADLGTPSGSGGSSPGGAGGSAGSQGGNSGSGGQATGGMGGMAGTGGDPMGGAGGTLSMPDSGADPDAGGTGGTTGTGGTGGNTGTGGSGGVTVDASTPEMKPVSAVGCADGTREGYLSLTRYPGIAACAGGWTEPGLLTPASHSASCDYKAGNSGPLPNGTGCSTADLCAVGWHVCESFDEVKHLADDCDDALSPSNARPVFFATRQPASNSSCNNSSTSTIIGCGNIGAQSFSNCDPLNARMGSVACADNAPWQCGDPGQAGSMESRLVTKPGPLRGGVLCCRI